MIGRVSRQLKKKQSGFTSIEVLVAIVIASVLGTGVLATFSQTIRGNITVKNQLTTVNNVRNAGYWLTRDIQMSQYMSNWPSSFALPNTDPLKNKLDLERSDFYYVASVSILYKITYKIDGTDLQRTEYKDITGTGNSYEQQSQVIVANNIASISGQYNSTTSIISIIVTSTVGTGSNQKSTTQSFLIKPRT